MSAASGGGVPVMSKDQLEYIADQHTLSFGRYDGKEDPGFSAWKFAAYYLKKTVRFEWLSNDGCILGLSSFSKGTKIPVYLPDENGMDWLEIGPDTILLSKAFEDSLLGPSKPRFTLMHECAHHLLHKGYFQRKAASGSGEAVAYSLQKDEERTFTHAVTKYLRVQAILLNRPEVFKRVSVPAAQLEKSAPTRPHTHRQRKVKLKAFLAELKKRKTPLVEFDPLVWQATVSEMVVNADMTVMFKFRDGTELPWTIETGIHKYKKRDKAKSPNEQEAE